MLRLFVHIYKEFIKKKKKNNCSMAKKNGSGFYFLSQRNSVPQPSLFSHGNQQVPSSCHWN